ncbi:MAG: hypothetical protein IKV36_04690 [Clostridia bacterium]|nr:hypothetical protein [Clostridia bacterium]
MLNIFSAISREYKVEELKEDFISEFEKSTSLDSPPMLINSFAPKAELLVDEMGKTAKIKLKLKKPVKVIFAVYCLLAIIIETLLVYFVIRNDISESLILLLPIGLVLFGYLILFVGFNLSAKAKLNELEEVLIKK